jgi:hypothetical protein
MGALCFCGESATEMGMSQAVDNIQNDESTVWFISHSLERISEWWLSQNDG